MVVALDLKNQELDFLVDFDAAQRIYKTDDLLANFTNLLFEFLLVKLNDRGRSAFGVGLLALKCGYCSPGSSD